MTAMLAMPATCDNLVVIHVSDTYVAVDAGTGVYLEDDWDLELELSATSPVTLLFVLDASYDPGATIEVTNATGTIEGLTARLGMFEYVVFDEDYLEFEVLGSSPQAPTPPIIVRKPNPPDPEPA